MVKRQSYHTEIHSINKEGQSAVAEKFIRTLKNKMNKSMTSISKNMYFDKLDEAADNYNNTINEQSK